MLEGIKNYFPFLVCCLLFWIVGGVLLSSIAQGEAIEYFSNYRQPFWDAYFKYGTRLAEEYGYIFFILLLLVFRQYKAAGLVFLLSLLSTALSFVLKRYYKAPRPAKFFETQDTLDQLQLVEGIVLNTGNTSFPSGHTIAGFALFTFLAFLFPKKLLLQLLCFGLALTVALSRVYLVQHFFVDVYFGSLLGFGLALLTFALSKRHLAPIMTKT